MTSTKLISGRSKALMAQKKHELIYENDGNPIHGVSPVNGWR
jgi:hypothetical protein